MKKSIFYFLLIFIVGTTSSYAQFSRYIIRLKDKAGSSFTISNPVQYLTQRAIDRRKRYNISIDQTDLPVIGAYIDSIRLSGAVTILNVSKWFNQVCIQTTDAAALTKINSFSFVLSSSPIAARANNQISIINKFATEPAPAILPNNNLRQQGTADYYNYGQSYGQINLNNTEFLHNHGFRGEGMQMSIMDAGFLNYKTLPTFDSVRNNNQILGTWDFVANTEDVNNVATGAHGVECFSTISANNPGTFVGTAPKTSFYLFRTEDVNSEYPVEEQNWAAAAERADSLGVDVFSVSLGYNTFDSSRFDYTYSDMDGHTTLMARAANMAARKGIVTVVANGNEGGNSWHYLTTPADADSVVAVGAVNVARQIASFSSYGPSSDGQIKPDVAAVGAYAVVANANTGAPTYGNGTSFACPIMAGLTTCLWQAFPEVNNMAIIDALHYAGDKYTSPDNRTGYGIPDSKKAFVHLIKKLFSQQIAINNTCKTTISLTVKTASDMSIFIQRKLPADADYVTIATKNITSSFMANNFAYVDDLSSIAINSSIKYRFKMSITADTTFYLDSATVNYIQPCTGIITDSIIVTPNPVTDNLSVIIKRTTPVQAAIEVYAENGQKLYSLVNQTVTGSTTFLVPMKKLSHGVYFVSVFIDNKKIITKRVIR